MAQSKSDWIVGVSVISLCILLVILFNATQLHYAFQDASYLYMVMDYMPGM